MDETLNLQRVIAECELCNEPYSDGPSETFRIPRLLICGHTFCQVCLEEWKRFGSSSQNISTQVIVCPKCRVTTTVSTEYGGVSALPRNFELLKICGEIESQLQNIIQLRATLNHRMAQKQQIAEDAEEATKLALLEADSARLHALELAKQMELTTKERKEAESLANAASLKASRAAERSEMLQQQTESLRNQIIADAEKLQKAESEALSSAEIAVTLQQRTNELEKEVDEVNARLSIHCGNFDPSRILIIVCDPITTGAWPMNFTRYTIVILTTSDPHHKKEILEDWRKGLREINYSVVKVYRRYSDFVWLHKQLCCEYSGLLIPELPEKQLRNMDPEFVEERMHSLQAFLKCLLQHKVIGTSSLVVSFLLSSTEEYEALRDSSMVSVEESEFDDFNVVTYNKEETHIDPCNGDNNTGTDPTSLVSSALSWSALSAVSAVKGSASWFLGNSSGDTGDLKSCKIETSDLKKSLEEKYEYIQEIYQLVEVASSKGKECNAILRQQIADMKALGKSFYQVGHFEQNHDKPDISSLLLDISTFIKDKYMGLYLSHQTHWDDGIQEPMRLQYLLLGSIIAAKNRLEKDVDKLQDMYNQLSKMIKVDHDGNSASDNSNWSGSNTSSNSRKKEIHEHEEKIRVMKDNLDLAMQKYFEELESLDPQRSTALTESLVSFSQEQKKDAQERIVLWQNIYREIAS